MSIEQSNHMHLMKHLVPHLLTIPTVSCCRLKTVNKVKISSFFCYHCSLVSLIVMVVLIRMIMMMEEVVGVLTERLPSVRLWCGMYCTRPCLVDVKAYTGQFHAWAIMSLQDPPLYISHVLILLEGYFFQATWLCHSFLCSLPLIVILVIIIRTHHHRQNHHSSASSSSFAPSTGTDGSNIEDRCKMILGRITPRITSLNRCFEERTPGTVWHVLQKRFFWRRRQNL